ncbi:hypothetical protein A2U94_07570 [Bacillus sp. VT 712]|nr:MULTISPECIES: phosphatase PAP2 family protein [Bacillaceae]KZB92142.1 hypothetical protein A2U94_07570 [Bacillus sp. VT 712]SCC03634.1 PAP2 superfamily protein [Priestia flexa]
MRKWRMKYRFILLLLLALMGMFIGVVMTINGPVHGIDAFFLTIATNIHNHELVIRILEVTSFFASKPMIIILSLLLVGVLGFNKRDTVGAVTVLAFVLSGYLLNNAVKAWIERLRPTLGVEGYSFPSGHAMLGLMLYGFLLFFIIFYVKNETVRKASIIVFSLLILFIGVSRFLLAEHYMTDVLGGYLLGGFWLTVGLLFYTLVKAYLTPTAPMDSKQYMG